MRARRFLPSAARVLGLLCRRTPAGAAVGAAAGALFAVPLVILLALNHGAADAVRGGGYVVLARAAAGAAAGALLGAFSAFIDREPALPGVRGQSSPAAQVVARRAVFPGPHSASRESRDRPAAKENFPRANPSRH